MSWLSRYPIQPAEGGGAAVRQTPLPSWWPRKGAPGLRSWHDFLLRRLRRHGPRRRAARLLDDPDFGLDPSGCRQRAAGPPSACCSARPHRRGRAAARGPAARTGHVRPHHRHRRPSGSSASTTVCAVAGRLHPEPLRAPGLGRMPGAGRPGAVFGPWLGGVLGDRGRSERGLPAPRGGRGDGRRPGRPWRRLCSAAPARGPENAPGRAARVGAARPGGEGPGAGGSPAGLVDVLLTVLLLRSPTSPGRTRRWGSRRAGPRSAGSPAPCRPASVRCC